MRGYFEFESSVLDKDYKVKCFIGMESMLQYCEEENTSFNDLMLKFSSLSDSGDGDIVGLIRFLKKLTYYSYQNYCELMDEPASYSEKKLNLLFDGANGGIEAMSKTVTTAFMDIMPKAPGKKTEDKKKG